MKQKEEHLFQHFGKSEIEFVKKTIDACHQVEETYTYHLTHFLNPQEEKIVEAVAAHFGLQTYSSRRILSTENRRIIIAPDYYILEVVDFEMSLLEIGYPRKFHTLSHAQVLGTLLNQLGIKRPYLGDILVGEDMLLVLMDRKFAELARMNIDKIARVPVSWKEKDIQTTILPEGQKGEVDYILLSSMRLDKVVSVAFKLPRQQVVKRIEAGQVKVDYKDILQPAKEVIVGNLISVRGLGRLRLVEMVGLTKSGKYKIMIERMKK